MFKEITDLFVHPKVSISETVAVLNRSGIGIVLVVDEEQRLQGTVTDGDIRRALLQHVSLEDPVEGIMNPHPIFAEENVPDEDLLNMMKLRRRRQIPLLRDGQVVDIIWQDKLLNLSRKQEVTTPVVIMCGGLGTRLRPLTETCPKPLLPLQDRPVLEHILENLIAQGFRKVYLAVNYLGEQIEDHFGNGASWDIEIEYIRESERMGTAGALGLMRERFKEPILVLNGDVMTRINYARFIEFHIERNFDLSVAINPHQIQVPFGVVQLAGDHVVKLDEKPTYSYFVNAGLYVLNPEMIRLIPKSGCYNMTELISLILQRRGRVGAFPVHEYWMDIGRHEDFEKAERELSPEGPES